jgi:hypothetical protein
LTITHTENALKPTKRANGSFRHKQTIAPISLTKYGDQEQKLRKLRSTLPGAYVERLFVDTSHIVAQKLLDKDRGVFLQHFVSFTKFRRSPEREKGEKNWK